MRPSIGPGLLLVASLALTGCKDYGEINQQAEERRYRECLSAGGSYSTDDVNYRCDLPGSGE